MRRVRWVEKGYRPSGGVNENYPPHGGSGVIRPANGTEHENARSNDSGRLLARKPWDVPA